jgi:hypothetical protein
MKGERVGNPQMGAGVREMETLATDSENAI